MTLEQLGVALQFFNVLLIPIAWYLIKIEHRLTSLEGLAQRVEKLEARIFPPDRRGMKL